MVNKRTNSSILGLFYFGMYVNYIRENSLLELEKEKKGRREDILELILTNVNRLITSSTLVGYRHFIIFIDDYLRFG